MSSSEGTTNDAFEVWRLSKRTYNLLKVPGYAMALIKVDVSFNLGAWLANAN